MSKIWGRTPISNADKRHLTQSKYLAESFDKDGKSLGFEERIDRRPMGKVERFVDPSGSVMNQQLYSDGDSRKNETAIRERAALHKKGFVEYAKCPLKHGTRYSSPIATKDFAKMPAHLSEECRHDPKVMERKDGDLYAKTACPHIEWLITYRREAHAEAYAKRNNARVELEKREERKRELDDLQRAMLEQQLEQAKAARAAKTPKTKDASE